MQQLNLFSEIDRDKIMLNFFQAYFDARKNKRNTINALAFEKHLEANLFALANEIIERKYTPKPSICFIVDKPVKREIFAADFRDRVIHHFIYNYISPIFEKTFINDSGKLLAGDSTKFRAQNSKKNNFNQKKIDRHLEYIENKLNEYNQALAENDGDKKAHAKNEIKKHNNRKGDYKNLEQQLKETGEVQVSTSDPDSRQMIIRNHITEVAYNVQTTVDAKHNIPIDYKVTNHNDKKAMGNMLQRAKSILHTNEFTALFDKGYHTGSEFDMADTLGIKVMVAIPDISKSSQAPDPAYNVEHFIYNEQDNTYTCPQGHLLTTNGTWHTAESGSRFQQYKTRKCKGSAVQEKCTKARKNGKIVQRRLHAANIEANRQRIENDPATYKRRQAIVEHPYGTIKRQWGFSYIMTKKYLHRASADVGFMMIAYNLRRLINIIGKDSLQKYLQTVLNTIFNIFKLIWLKITHFENLKYFTENMRAHDKSDCKELNLTQSLAYF